MIAIICFLHFFTHAAMIQSVDIEASAISIQTNQPVTPENITTEVLPDSVQITFSKTQIAKAVIKTVDHPLISKIFVYAYSPDTVRLRMTPKDMSTHELFSQLQLEPNHPIRILFQPHPVQREKEVTSTQSQVKEVATDAPIHQIPSPVLQKKTNPKQHSTWGGTGLSIMGFFLLIGGGVYWIYRKKSLFEPFSSKGPIGSIDLLHRRYLDPKKSLLTVQVQVSEKDHQYFLLAVNADNFQLIGELDIDLGQKEQTEAAPSDAFKRVISSKIPNLALGIKGKLPLGKPV